VIQNGVEIDSDIISKTPAHKANARLEFGLSSTGNIFIYTGPLIDRKNIEFIIAAFKSSALQDDTLLILGTGPLHDRLVRLTNGSKNIKLLGERPDISEFLSLADCYVSASIAEGLPNSVLEALACGLPVLLSDIPAHREVLQNAPNAGDCFSLSSSDDLISSIRALKLNPNRSMAARQCAEPFSALKMSLSYQDLYRRLLREVK